MGFRTFCDNKGCRKEMEPVLDKQTNEVYCTECGKTINSLTDFAKRQMVVLGQIRRADKKKQAWSFKCVECQKEGPPKLNKEGEKDAKGLPIGDKLLCSYCEHELTNISKPFAQIILTNLRAQRRAGQS
jgi:DNA-directed RNA polymerase subunit RPC12/RpoP